MNGDYERIDQHLDDALLEEDDDIHPGIRESGCPHKWAYTGTAYGGDDSRWSGEGRCYCIYCGADGDA